MTRAKKATATVEDFAFDGVGITIADDPFAFDSDPFGGEDAAANEWLNLPGEPSTTIAHDVLLGALREDPFATSHVDDCIPGEGITPVPFSRFERASAAYIAACRSQEGDYEAQEIHRLIAIYWLKKSRPMWQD